MANIILFDPLSSPVANRVRRYIRSVQGSPYAGRNDAVVYETDGDPQDVADLMSRAVPMSLWKVSGGTVVEFTQSDKDAIAAADATALINAEINAVDNSRIAYLSGRSPTELLNATKFKSIL